MRSASHEKKILENIQEISYCTECMEDFLSHSLIQFGNTWKHLCWKCYRKALRDMRQEIVRKRDANSAQQKNEP
jgi:hypothetical protein